MDNELYIGSRVSVYWPNDHTWFPGTITKYNKVSGFLITYDDGDEEEIQEFDENIQIDEYSQAYLDHNNPPSYPQDKNNSLILKDSSSLFQDDFSDDEINNKKESKILSYKNSSIFNEDLELEHENSKKSSIKSIENDNNNLLRNNSHSNDVLNAEETLSDSIIIVPNRSFHEPPHQFSSSSIVSTSSKIILNDNDEKDETLDNDASIIIHENHENSIHHYDHEYDIQNSNSLYHIQESNRQLLQSQLPLLSKNSILLVGTILTIELNEKNYSNLKKNYQLNNNNNSNDEFFFKLSFIEDGPQPILFRCKTPIFTSSFTQFSNSNNYKLTWDASSFRFDIILSKFKSKNQQSAICGDLLLALYLNNSSNNSNILVGQINIDLFSLAQSGTIEHNQNSNYECRSLNGTIELNSSSSSTSLASAVSTVAVSEIQLFMCWKESDFVSTPSSTSDSVNAFSKNNSNKSVKPNTQVKKVLSKPDSARNPPTSLKESSGAPRPSSVGKQKVATLSTSNYGGVATRTSSGKVLIPPPRKISSSIVRKKMDETRRIEKENKALQIAIQKKSSGLQRGSAYGEVPNSQPKVPIKEQESESKVFVRRNNDPGKNEKILQDLKISVANELEEIKSIKSKINNIDSQIRKYDIISEKKNAMTVGSSSASISPTNTRPSSPRGSTKSNANVKFIEYLPPITDENEKKKNAEYKVLREEYDLLQGFRRAMSVRKKNSMKLLSNNNEYYYSAKKLLFLSRFRIENVLEEEFGPILTSYSSSDPFFNDIKNQLVKEQNTFDNDKYSYQRLIDSLKEHEIISSINKEKIESNLLLLLASKQEYEAILKHAQIYNDSLKNIIQKQKQLHLSLLEKVKDVQQNDQKYDKDSPYLLENRRNFLVKIIEMNKTLEFNQYNSKIYSAYKNIDIQLNVLLNRKKERELKKKIKKN